MISADDPEFINKMNNDVSPDKPMVQHGANDNYYVKDENGQTKRDANGNPVMKRPPEDPNEKFLIAEPDGTTRVAEGPEQLKNYYDANGMRWPY